MNLAKNKFLHNAGVVNTPNHLEITKFKIDNDTAYRWQVLFSNDVLTKEQFGIYRLKLKELGGYKLAEIISRNQRYSYPCK